MEERERWRRERRHEEETTRGWTVVHSLRYILLVQTLPTSHAERSPLNLSAPENTDDGEDIERGGGGGGGEVSVWDQKWKREREMETGEET